MQIPKDHLKLHFIILLNSFVPLILARIQQHLDYEVIVSYRTFAAFIILGTYLYLKKEKVIQPPKESIFLLLSGLLVAAYWSFLILSIKEGNVSVALIGMATTSLWISFIEPLFFKVKPKPFQSLIGINAVISLYVIFQSDFEYGKGLALGLVGSFFSAILTIVSSQLSKKYKPMVITLYQMAGAWIGISIFLVIYIYFIQDSTLKTVRYMPEWSDILLILGLAFVFSVYAYSAFVEVMRTISAFTVSLVNNLSPVYGILIAVIVTDEAKTMTKGFVVGTMVLLISVFAYPILVYYLNKFQRQAS